MELAPRYCRSCGSRILVKNVCHNCNNNPLRGDNYCYDCGSLTPIAESCLHCGARYKTTFPIKPMLIIAGVFVVIIGVTGFFLSRSGKSSDASKEDAVETQTAPPVTGNNELLNKRDTVSAKADTLGVIHAPLTDTAAAKVPDSLKTISAGIFSSEELKAYKIKCSYFLKNQRSQVLFFISNNSGYIKVNEKIYAMERKRKGVDVAVFGGDKFETIIRIDGLSGSEKEWMASCTLIVKDINQNVSIRQKVYSSCIEL